MTSALRILGSVILWIVAAAGVVCALVWGATALGLVKPLIVISGSMEPGIMTGDLIIDVPIDTATASVGGVSSLFSDVTGNDVTHRIVAIEPAAPAPDGTAQWEIRMKGDANDTEDGGPYLVGDTIWQPALQLPGMGYAIVTITKPSVAIPLGITLAACLGISLLPGSTRTRRADRAPAPVSNPTRA